MDSKSTHGGQRPGAGRPSRPEPKAKPIWCGQISDDDRQVIIDSLTPEERFKALMAAAWAKRTTPPPRPPDPPSPDTTKPYKINRITKAQALEKLGLDES